MSNLSMIDQMLLAVVGKFKFGMWQYHNPDWERKIRSDSMDSQDSWMEAVKMHCIKMIFIIIIINKLYFNQILLLYLWKAFLASSWISSSHVKLSSNNSNKESTFCLAFSYIETMQSAFTLIILKGNWPNQNQTVIKFYLNL